MSRAITQEVARVDQADIPGLYYIAQLGFPSEVLLARPRSDAERLAERLA